MKTGRVYRSKKLRIKRAIAIGVTVVMILTTVALAINAR